MVEVNPELRKWCTTCGNFESCEKVKAKAGKGWCANWMPKKKE